MAIILALPKLFDDVVAQFAADATGAANYFGWREPAQQRSGNRVIWIPGDPNDGIGKMLPARWPGQNPRPLATLEELFTCEIIAVDATQPENERAQYQATRVLFDAWFRAVYLAAHGTVAVVSSEWLGDRKERRYGSAIRAVCTIQSMIPDAAADSIPTDSTVAASLIELDVTDTFTIP